MSSTTRGRTAPPRWMRGSPDSRTTGPRRSGIAAAAVMLTIALLGPAAPAGAATAAPATPAPRTATTPDAGTGDPQGTATEPGAGGSEEPNVRRSCAIPEKPGFAACFALQRTDVNGRAGLLTDATPRGYSPADLRSAYRLPSETAGDGQLVAVVAAYDHPKAEQDLAVYRQQFGLAPCTTDNGCFRKVNQRGDHGDYPTPDAGWAQEISLDLDMVSAACPSCKLLLVEADSAHMADLGQAVNTAVAMGAKYVSNSYGIAAEVPTQTDYDPYFDHPGVAVTVASGDYGYGTTFPASSPHVTAVGGTSLRPDDDERGWAETAWDGAGSGCSAYEPKPLFQTDTGCDNRTVADVSAVADPATGVAVYHSYQFHGWSVFGGTSAAAPLIAAAYALAGEPVDGTYPNSYPYDDPRSLNDVTSGANGVCDTTYLCTAGAGYDGPTGLGTPAGVAAFGTAPRGTLAGTVTSDGQPLMGARVSAGHRTAITDADGHYSMSVEVGSHPVTASKYGYRTTHHPAVTITEDHTTTVPLTMTAADTVTLSGTVRDGSGHGWPVYAAVAVDGAPGAPVYTDPVTGAYHVELPDTTEYTLHVEPFGSGYRNTTVTVEVGRYDRVANVEVAVDPQACLAAPGYGYRHRGAATDFSGWQGSTPQDGWTVTDAKGKGNVWLFDDPGDRGNLTGGSGSFAIVDEQYYGTSASFDTSLVSPVVDFSGIADPVIGFRTDFQGGARSTASVDLSTDGGRTWESLWSRRPSSFRGPVTIEVPQAAGRAQVQVRFRYTGYWSFWWEVDDVYLGQRRCEPLPGGLLVGTVTDENTGDAINGATVTIGDATATSRPTPDDPQNPDGYFRLFSPGDGPQEATAEYGRYRPRTVAADLRVNQVERADIALAAGHLTVTPGKVETDPVLGRSASRRVTITNDGAVPAHVVLTEQPGSGSDADRATAAAATAEAPVQHVPGRFRAGPRGQRGSAAAEDHAERAAGSTIASASGRPWRPIADHPVAISDNGVATIGGQVYSVGGYDGFTDIASGYRYDPAAMAWAPIADMSISREAPQAAAVAGKLYVFGGWNDASAPAGSGEVYDPRTDSWSPAAGSPVPVAGAATAVLDGKIYVVGGCRDQGCGTDAVTVYDPATDSWSRVADYPRVVSWLACGGIDGMLYCAGGQGVSRPLTDAYAYSRQTNTWTAIPDLPRDMWGASYGAANGELLVSGGIINVNSTLTNEGFAFDPDADAWHRLPNAGQARYRAGSACGFYRVGGSITENDPVTTDAEVLPGYDRCNVSDVPWLQTDRTEFDLAPGHSVRVRVTTTAAAVTEPGTSSAWLGITSDTPYVIAPVDVRMEVQRPRSWGQVTGTVHGTGCDGTAAVAGATVWIDGKQASYTLTTDADGQYSLWLDRRNNPLSVVVTAGGFRPGSATVRVRQGTEVVQDFTLTTITTCR